MKMDEERKVVIRIRASQGEGGQRRIGKRIGRKESYLISLNESMIHTHIFQHNTLVFITSCKC